jgi:hypothetical protein
VAVALVVTLEMGAMPLVFVATAKPEQVVLAVAVLVLLISPVIIVALAAVALVYWAKAQMVLVA